MILEREMTFLAMELTEKNSSQDTEVGKRCIGEETTQIG